MTDDPHAGQPVLTGGPDLRDARAAMILVHGRGASAADILPLGYELADPRTALLAPQAAGGTWYPNSFLAPLESNEPWLSSALRSIGRLVENAIAAGLPASAITLAGFSQGACLATEYVARHPARYAALLAFTGGLIGPPGTKFEHAGDLGGTPVYLSAGDPDPHVPWARMEESRAVLQGLGGRVTLRRWPGRPHTILREEVDEARGALASAINRKSDPPGEPPATHRG
jgi:predicted esterase